MSVARGGCFCGAIRYEVNGPLSPVVGWHSVEARKASGHVAALTAADRKIVRVEGEPTWFESGPGVRRGFCGACGAPLFWDHVDRPTLSIFAGSLDATPGLRIDSHLFTAEKGDYYDIQDGLPQAPGDVETMGKARPRSAAEEVEAALTLARRREGFCVAIDGPAAAGKGTIGKALAQRFGLAYLDTGTLYRAVAAKMLDEEDDPENAAAAARAARAITPQDMQRGGMRSEAAGAAASKVAAVPAVRVALLEFQRDFSRNRAGAILDGRDIGTIVRPDADVKLYVVASDEARAKRRAEELGADVKLVIDQLRERDARDAQRSAAPMTPADDAILIDTTNMSSDDAIAAAINVVVSALKGS